jgi:PAS domain S-box-containing protein
MATLAGAFNIMTGKLKETVGELYQTQQGLEERVKERTSDLLNSNITLQEEIQERKRVESSLKESEESLSMLVESAPDGILVFDVDHGHFVQANQNVVDMLGYPREELLTKNWLDISVALQQTGRKSEEQGVKLINEVVNNGSVFSEWTFQRSDGTEIVTELRLNVLPSIDSKQIRGSLLDISEKREAEKELILQHRLSKVFMEAMPCFAVLLRSDRTIIAANKIALDFGAKHGQTCFKSMFGFEKPCWWCLGPECLEENEPQHEVVEDRGINWDAYWVPVEEDLYLHYAFDITEKVKTAEDQQRLINQMQHVQKLESLGVLAGGIAHDFNNLLMGILGNASLALNRMKQSTPIKKHVEQIELSAQKAADLTNQMLAYSGRGQFMLSKVYLNVAVNEIKQLLQTVVSKDVVMKFDISDDLFPVDADITQLNQVIMNLVINASDAIDNKDGQVCVSTGSIYCDKEYLTSTYLDDPLPEGKYIYFQVVDNGRGMDESTLERIFDPFFSTKDTGRGLGLAAVLGIVRGHRGAIRIESEIGKGSTFTVLLPEVDHAQEAIAETVDKKSGRYIYNDMTVLLVDDDDTVRDVTKDMLEELGFTVITAENGKKGFDLYKKRKTQINLVILDMTMPGMTGDEVFLKIREIDKDIPVILSSGYSELETATALIEKGLSGFIQKPYKQDDLYSKIEEVLNN